MEERKTGCFMCLGWKHKWYDINLNIERFNAHAVKEEEGKKERDHRVQERFIYAIRKNSEYEGTVTLLRLYIYI